MGAVVSATTGIEWTATVHPDGSVTPGKTWNPVRGCSIVSPGCVNCYAMKQAHRFSGTGKPYDGLTKQTSAGPQWAGHAMEIDSMLTEPLSWRTPCRVFVNSMSDLFHPSVTDAFIDRVFGMMACAPQHTFQILTKRADRMLSWARSRNHQHIHEAAKHVLGFDHPKRRGLNSGDWPLPNVWLGVSVENQKFADERIPLLLQTPAAVRFISAEPLLGPVDLVRGGWTFLEALRPPPGNSGGHERGLDWVIVGGESGPKARQCERGWVRSIVHQCKAAGVAVFVKQLGSTPYEGEKPYMEMTIGARRIVLRDRKGGDPSEWPEDIRVREFPRV